MTVVTDHKVKSQQAQGKYGRQMSDALFHSQFPVSTLPQEQGKRRVAYPERWVIIGLFSLIGFWALWQARQPVWELLALVGDQAAVSARLQGYGAWGPLVLALVQLVQVLIAFIPGHVFLIAAGYVYGFPIGFTLNLVFIVAASQFTFSLARWAGRPLVSRLVAADVLDRWYRIGEEQGFAFFTIAFLLPVFPTDVMNFVAGLSGISSRRFLAANFLGRLPSAIMLTLIGSHGLKLSPVAWGVMVVIVASLYIAGRYSIARIERRHAQSPDS